jgi:large subunit ribosomal protein L2
MGKRIIARARGKGGPRYRAPSHRYLGRVEYHPFSNVTGKVIDILHDPGRSAPVAIVRFDDGRTLLHIAPEGLAVDRIIIFGIETFPNSGPKLCRASGSFATVVGKTEKSVTVQLSSGAIKELDPRCRATIGVPAGGERVEKPWVKAGKKVHAMMARGKLYPRSKGVAMTPTDHPFGGKSKHKNPPVSRGAPPGAKVGSISPKRLGKRKL